MLFGNSIVAVARTLSSSIRPPNLYNSLLSRQRKDGVCLVDLVFSSRRSLGRMSDAAIPGPVQSAVTVKLKQELKPEHLDVINESYMHNVPKGTESHFKVVVVSEQFQGKPLIKKHQMVHSVLHEELDSGAIHALSIVAKTPEQWAKSQEVPDSPKCMGGSKN